MNKKYPKFFRILLVIITITVTSIAQPPTKKKSPAMKAAETITAKQLSDYLYFIASDAMEGRDTPSRGLDTTAEFIKFNLSRWGFKAAGDNNSFFQKIALRRDAMDKDKSKLEINNQQFAFGNDLILFSGNIQSEFSAPIVYVQDGWWIKSKNRNPYQGLDVRGKIVAAYREGESDQLSLLPLPEGFSASDLKGERGKDWGDVADYARANGALGVIVLPSKYWAEGWDGVQKNLGGNRLYVEKFAPPIKTQGQMPIFVASVKLSEAIFAGERENPLKGKNDESFELRADKKINLKVVIKPETLWTQNVVAVWEGSDPTLKSEMVAIGAHYDHLGINLNLEGEDKIFNGADDDGSGTTAVLAIAEALAKSTIRPKRSILLVWHCGEEKGLWGSKYFTNYPTVDLKNIVAQLNIDMIGRSKKTTDTNPQNKELAGEAEIYVIGSKMMSSKLGEIVTNVNKSYLNLNYNFRYDNLNDPNRFFYRSDHFNYAKKGIPIAFWFDGVHGDYHGVDDEPNLIDYKKMQDVTQTIFLTLWQLADEKTRPKVDQKLPWN